MKIPPDLFALMIGLGILLCAIQCFFGYRIFKFILGIVGFTLGGFLAGGVGYSASNEPLVAVLAGLLGGILGVVLLMGLYFVGIFLFGGLLGVFVGATFFAAAGSQPEPVVLVILALIGGGLALVFQKFMIILSTAFNGAWNVVAGIACLATGTTDPANLEKLFRPDGSQRFVTILSWIVLGTVGAIYQYRSARETRPAATAQPDTGLRLDRSGASG